MQLYNIIYHAASLLILFLGLLVLFNNFRSKNSIIFSAWTFSASIWMQSLYWGFWFSQHSHWMASLTFFRLAFAFGVLLLSLMTIFYYYFPRVTFKLNNIVLYLYLLLTVGVFVISLTPFIHESLVIEDGIYVGDVFGDLYWIYTVSIVINFFAGLYLAWNKFKTSKGIEKGKIGLVTVGYFIFIFFAILTNVILPYFGVVLLLLQEIVPFLTLVFLIPTFFSLQRYRFFNLSYVSLIFLRNTISYLFILLLFLAFDFLFKAYSSLSETSSLFLSLLLSLLISRSIDLRIPRFIGGELRNFKNFISELKNKIYYQDSLSGIQIALESTFLISLNYTQAQIYLVRSKKSSSNLHFPVYLKNNFTNELEKIKNDVLVLDEILYRFDDVDVQNLLGDTFKNLDSDLCLPLFSEQKLIAFFLLKRKPSFGSYPREVINEIFSLQKGLQTSLMNSLLKLNLEEENNLMKSIIDKKTGQLKRKINKINELLDQQSDFIAVTAHEFRTPLSIAIFQLQEILSNTEDDEEAMNELRVLDDSLGELKNLTAKLFAVQQYDLSKVSLSLAPMSVVLFFEKLFTNFGPIMSDKKLHFSIHSEIDDKLQFNIDHLQLLQVFHNILTNASKFTPAGGDVSLTLSKKDKNICISVDDNGSGIPENMKKTIFNKFRTKDKNAGSGVGLGLYICKKIIGLHKGKIWVEDSQSGGASFKVELPLI